MALYARKAESISGIVPIENGGTGASTTATAKANLGLELVDNTTDALKPVSTATQTALDAKVDKVTGSSLITDASITRLANTSGTNTGDQDLSSFATNTNLALKANIASPTFTGTATIPTPFTVGTTSVTATGTQLNYINTATGTTGTGSLVYATSPTLITPALGTPSALVGTNITGTAAGLTAGNVTTNANLTGEVTSTGNATTVNNAAVIAKTLTGFTSGAGTVAAADNILQAIQKVDGNVALKANTAAPTFTGAVSGNNETASTLAGFAANINAQTGTTYTLLASDNGKIITLANASAITVTVPSLFAGFNCMIIQTGTGEITLTSLSTTISNRQSFTKSVGTNAIATLIALISTSFISSGDMK